MLPAGLAPESFPALVEEESARCKRLGEVKRQREALAAARLQAGFAGVIGNEPVDTVDMVAQRDSMSRLDATLQDEAEALARAMGHVPEGP
jgi:hypothetical protein